MQKKIRHYLRIWEARDYFDGIPDEVPNELMVLGLAPSYKSIAFAILQNDHAGKSLGFYPQQSKWYSALKSIEIKTRNDGKEKQQSFNFPFSTKQRGF